MNVPDRFTTTTTRVIATRTGVMALAFLLMCGCEHTSLRRKPPRPQNPVDPIRAVNVKVTPDQAADVKLAMARSLESQGELAPAADLYKQVLDKNPKRIDVMTRLAVVHDRRGDFEASAPLYQKALKAKPDDASLLCDRGYSLYLQNRWRESETCLRRAIELKPDLTRAHNNLGLVLGRTGHAGEALNEFAKAGCPPTDAHLNLAFALTLERRFDEAKAQYQLALTSTPSSAVAQNGLRNLQVLAQNNELPPLPTDRDHAILRASATPRAN
jgi:tetratricopeptide (TPR) repeat protein